jgi:hypothetical protein
MSISMASKSAQRMLRSGIASAAISSDVISHVRQSAARYVSLRSNWSSNASTCEAFGRTG